MMEVLTVRIGRGWRCRNGRRDILPRKWETKWETKGGKRLLSYLQWTAWPVYPAAMKFFLAILAYLLIAFVLGWGILLAVKGSPWLLIVGFLAYVVAFGKLGCLPGKSH